MRSVQELPDGPEEAGKTFFLRGTSRQAGKTGKAGKTMKKAGKIYPETRNTGKLNMKSRGFPKNSKFSYEGTSDK